MDQELRELYQQVILDHNKSPRNFRLIDHPTNHAEGYNPLCGDNINVFLSVNDKELLKIFHFKARVVQFQKRLLL
jgi:nitrogen fixation NifU-like protein